MTNEQLITNATDVIKKLNNKLETINYEWNVNMKILIVSLRGYAASIEAAKDKADEFEAYSHVIDCKNNTKYSYETLHNLYHEKQNLKSILELLSNEQKVKS